MDVERERTRGRDPEAGYRARNAFIERQLRGRILVKGVDAVTSERGASRQSDTSWYLGPERLPDTVLQSWYVFINNIRVHSGKHIHQGGICLYVLDGRGYTVVEGVREDWAPGDLILLPLKPGGVEHQHFDADPPSGARWLAFIYLPQFEHVATGIRQVETSYEYRRVTGDAGGPDDSSPYNPTRGVDGWPMDSFGKMARVKDGFNGYVDLIRRRNEERERAPRCDTVLHGDELAWELNPHGIMQWYLHPSLPDRLTRSYLFYRQEIPPGSRSGCQRHQGGKIFFIVEGHGYTVIDDERFDWERDDLIQLPLRPDGVVYQHFNASRTERARLIACEPNMVDALGVDRGAAFVQIENCPEYEV